MCAPKSHGVPVGSVLASLVLSKAGLAITAVVASGLAVSYVGIMAVLGLPFLVIAGIIALAYNTHGVRIERVRPAAPAEEATEAPRTAVEARAPRLAVEATPLTPRPALEPARPVFQDPVKVLSLDPAKVLVEVSRSA
jgi:hypothetical protein